MEHPTLQKELVGDFLRKVRTDMGLSLRRLAADSGVSTSQIMRLESGEYGISLEIVVKLSISLGLPVGFIAESCAALPPKGFEAAIKKSPAFTDFVKKAGIVQKFEQGLVVHLASTGAALFAHLLLSSNPLRWVRLATFPFELMRDEFRNQAELIEAKFDPIERRVALKALEREPWEDLFSRGLCDERIVEGFLKRKPESGSLLWYPLVDPFSVLKVED